MMFGFGARCFGNGFAGGYGFPRYMMMIPMLIMLIVLILIVYFVIKFINHGKHDFSHKVYSTSNALNILNERFAKGEISEEEYASRKKQLQE